jgi:hypothetical protein
MPKKISTKETVASTPLRAVKPKAAAPRVKTVKHSKAAAAPVAIAEPVAIIEIETETVTLSAHAQISQIAYGYWEARGFQPGNPEQDWLRAEQEFFSA